MRDDFAVFITSYNNPDNITTINSLNHSGYDGDWYIIIEDSDPQLERYKENIPEEHLLLYNKKEQEKYYDSCDNFHILDSHINSLSVVSYLAKILGYKYYYNAEDDYDGFYYIKNVNGKYIHKDVLDINTVFELYIDFLNCSKNIIFLSFFTIRNNKSLNKTDYFNMDTNFSFFNCNGWICDIDKEFEFISTISNDTLTCYNIYRKGLLTFVIDFVRNLHIYYFNIKNSNEYKESKKSGNSKLYKNIDYDIIKFYDLMVEPAATVLSFDKGFIERKYINNIIPKIIDERWKK